MNGIVAVRSACSRVALSQILAQLNSFGLNLSISLSALGLQHPQLISFNEC
jgi:hypothetical protein